MEIRDARPADVAAMEAVRVAGWKAAYRGLVGADLLDRLAVDPTLVAERAAALAEPRADRVVLVAEQDGRVVAMARLSPARDDDLASRAAAELIGLYVAPGSWSRGVGGRLLKEGYARLPHPLQVLWTLEGNAPARRFYERRGFRADGARRVRDLGGPAPEVRYRRDRP